MCNSNILDLAMGSGNGMYILFSNLKIPKKNSYQLKTSKR